jgi:hypothetical protein
MLLISPRIKARSRRASDHVGGIERVTKSALDINDPTVD